MVQWLTTEIGTFRTLVLAGLGLFALIFVGMIWMRTKALVPVVVALLTSGVVLWGVNNTTWFQNKVGNDAGSLAPLIIPASAHHPVTVHADTGVVTVVVSQALR